LDLALTLHQKAVKPGLAVTAVPSAMIKIYSGYRFPPEITVRARI
jgi:hypothetical protein